MAAYSCVLGGSILDFPIIVASAAGHFNLIALM